MTTFTHEIKAQVVLDSVSPNRVRLTTFAITYHRFIMAEIMMHRVQSRSSASSRAIPFELMLERAILHPALPVEWPSEQPGMQGGSSLEGDDLRDAEETLELIRASTTSILTDYIARHPDLKTRLHKSLLNRPLEWFMWTTTTLSATEWENYFRQRAHEAAQPEFRELAYCVRDALADSEPQQLPWYGWHLPFLDGDGFDVGLTDLDKIKVSTARCARTSYLNHFGQRSHADDFKLYDETLAKYGHWAPLEHPAVCLPRSWDVKHYGNFESPWHQFRHMIEHADGDSRIVEKILAQGAAA